MNLRQLLLLLLCSAIAASTAFAQNQEDFFRAISAGNEGQVDAMLKSSPALSSAKDKNGTSALMFAAYHQRASITQSILALRRNDLSVFEAAALGDDARVRALAANDPNLAKAFSLDGFTALHLASYFGRSSTLALLISLGADINAYSRNGLQATPLQSAAAARQLESARVLLQHGANPNCRGEGGYTPLHEAAGSGQVALAKLLITFNADVNAKGDDGLTPREIALEQKQSEILPILNKKVN